MAHYKNYKFWLILVSLALTIIPFFWFQPGEMDLGGDSTRLYFYEPLKFLQSISLYAVSPEGHGSIEPNYFYIPHFLLLYLLKSMLQSSYLLITFWNGLKLVVAFLAIVLIVKEIISTKSESKDPGYENVAAILSGLFYIFASSLIGQWDRALLSQNQYFLNPLFFLLVLKYLLYHNTKYLWVVLFFSVLFSPNFALTSGPPFFAFFPLAFLFISIYVTIFREKILPFKGIAVGLTFFLTLHFFHLLPQILSLLDPSSFSNTRVFTTADAVTENINYFTAILPLAKASVNILMPSANISLSWLSLYAPIVVVLGLIFNSRKNKVFLLTSLFFLLTFFLLTANITQLGVEIYKKFFSLPGFSMFRNFIGQWNHVYTFFYALLFGQALFIIFKKLKKISHVMAFSTLIAIIITASAGSFIRGDLTSKDITTTKNVKNAVIFNNDYIETLSYIKKLPDDGKILSLPFSDAYYQVVAGENNGAYVGSSSISYLANRSDFSGYQILTAPFSEALMDLSRKKDYKNIQRLLGLLNIKFIFHNADPKIYDDTFPTFPYVYIRQSLPNTQAGYKHFIDNIAEKRIYNNSHYSVYRVKNNLVLPEIYIAENVKLYSKINKDGQPNLTFFINVDSNKPVFLSKDDCRKVLDSQKCTTIISGSQPSLTSKKINPSKYAITIKNATKPFILVFSNAFNGSWKLFLNENVIPKENLNTPLSWIKQSFETRGMKKIAEKSHFLTNSYANGWLITPSEVNSKGDYQLILETTTQQNFYIASFVSLLSLILLIGWGCYLFLIKKYWYNKQIKK